MCSLIANYSRNIVYLIFISDKDSFVIKIAIDVNRIVLVDIRTPMLGLVNDKVEVVIVKADPNEIAVIINKTFFLFKLLYILL